MKARLITSSDVIVEKKFLQEFVKIHGNFIRFSSLMGFEIGLFRLKKKRKREKQYRDIINYYNKHDKFLTRIF